MSPLRLCRLNYLERQSPRCWFALTQTDGTCAQANVGTPRPRPPRKNWTLSKQAVQRGITAPAAFTAGPTTLACSITIVCRLLWARLLPRSRTLSARLVVILAQTPPFGSCCISGYGTLRAGGGCSQSLPHIVAARIGTLSQRSPAARKVTSRTWYPSILAICSTMLSSSGGPSVDEVGQNASAFSPLSFRPRLLPQSSAASRQLLPPTRLSVLRQFKPTDFLIVAARLQKPLGHRPDPDFLPPPQSSPSNRGEAESIE